MDESEYRALHTPPDPVRKHEKNLLLAAFATMEYDTKSVVGGATPRHRRCARV